MHLASAPIIANRFPNTGSSPCTVKGVRSSVSASLGASAFHAFARTTRLRGGPEAVELATWAEGLRSGLTGYVVAGCFISAEYEKILWISIFLSIVVADLARRHRAALAAAAEAEANTMEGVGGPLPQPS